MSAAPPIFGSAVRRLVWRDISRNKRRTAGIFLLTFVPLLFVYFVAVVGVEPTGNLDASDDVEFNFGQADASYFGDALPETLRFPGDPTIVSWNRVWHQIGGRDLSLSDIPIENPIVAGHFQAEVTGMLVDGVQPIGLDEVAASEQALALLGDDLGLGDRFNFGERSLEVVGVLESGSDGDEASVLFAPGALQVGSRETLVDWGDQPVPEELRPETDLEFEAMARSAFAGLDFRVSREFEVEMYSSTNPDAVLGATIFMLGLSIATGAVAFVAWRSSATRRLREAGLLASSGASGPQLEALQATQGFAIALGASLAAIILGVAVLVLRPFGWDWDGASRGAVFAFPILGIVLPTVIGVAAATIAAWWPARQVARSPLAASLDGRLPEPDARVANPVVGLLLMIIGVFMVSSSLSPFNDNGNLQLLLGGGGLIALAVGALPILRTLFRVAGHRVLLPHAPVTLRLILRSMARHAGRSAAAVLGIGAIVAGVWAGAIDTQEEIELGTRFGPERTGEVLSSENGSAVFTETGASFRIQGEQLHSGVFVNVNSPDAGRREASIAEVVRRVGEPDQRVDFAAFGSTEFGYLEARPTQELDGLLTETIDNTLSTGGGGVRLALPSFFQDDRPAATQREPAFDFSVLIYAVDLPQADLDVLLDDDSLFIAGVDRGLGVQRDEFGGPTSTQVQAILLAIGVAVAAFVIGMVTLVVSEEVRGEMALVALLGTSGAFARKFLAIHTFVIAAIGVSAGLFIGTGLRFVVDTGFFFPGFVLLALVALPWLLAVITYVVVRPSRHRNQQSSHVLAA